MSQELRIKNKLGQRGFTLMEIVVATTIFAVVSVAITSLFTYTLKINRRTEALRQASQGVRNLVELLVKEVRNGQIDYSAAISPCPSTYSSSGNSSLGVINAQSQQECFYLDLVTPTNLMFVKNGLSPQVLNPPNFTVELLKFFVRPLADPYPTGAVKWQPIVTMAIKFTVKLPTGEQVPIYYQTAVSTDKYDIPNN